MKDSNSQSKPSGMSPNTADVLYINYRARTRCMNLIHAADYEVYFRRLPVTDEMYRNPKKIVSVLETMGVIPEGLRIIPCPEEEFFTFQGRDDELLYFYLVRSPQG